MESLNNENIRNAVKLWCNDKEEAILKYGHISDWDVSNVTKMSILFYGMKNFNDCINNWDVSNVKIMECVFFDATSFNKNLNNWNVSNVTSMYCMFSNATSFNQNLNNWDVSNVIDMVGMFYNATSFNQNINNWNVSNVIVIVCMFNKATSFNQNISNWNVSTKCNVNNMFCFNTLIPFYKLKTTSFFDKPYNSMEPSKRKKIFDVLFNWDRRKNFIMFLKNYGYIINTK